MPEAFFGSPASPKWSAGTGDSNFELCNLPKWEDRFYRVLLVEIRLISVDGSTADKQTVRQRAVIGSLAVMTATNKTNSLSTLQP